MAPHFFLSAMYSTTAQAMLRPSYVDVPLPISSSMTRDLSVAFLRMFATSVISTMNVLWPLARSSDAPTLVNILSHTHTFALFAGTKLPTAAISTISASCLMYVDLPAMLGPVIMLTLLSSPSEYVSLGMNIPSSIILSTTGCLPSFMSMIPSVFMAGLTYLFCSAT